MSRSTSNRMHQIIHDPRALCLVLDNLAIRGRISCPGSNSAGSNLL
jgi:hypothetical protein